MPDGSNTPSRRSIVVSEFTNSVLDPDAPMLGPVENGGTIIANTAPGCWGPMPTPQIRGGHEVTVPVAVAGAEVGDGIAIRIKQAIFCEAGGPGPLYIGELIERGENFERYRPGTKASVK